MSISTAYLSSCCVLFSFNINNYFWSRDSGREKQRQELLKKKERGEIPRKQIDAKEQRKKQRRDVIKKKLDEKKKKQEKAKRRAEDDSDWEELARDALLIKRLKAGKV